MQAHQNVMDAMEVDIMSENPANHTENALHHHTTESFESIEVISGVSTLESIAILIST